MIALFVLGSVALAGDAKKRAHPHFDNQGTIRWYTKLSDAQAVAKKEGKLVFIEYGREA